MDAKAHEGKTLPYVLTTPEGYAPGNGAPLVILLHGFGASMYDLPSLSDAIDGEGYVFAYPNAPYRVDLGGSIGYSWALGRDRVEPPEPGTPPTETLLADTIAELIETTGVATGDVVLGGFSQGGALTLTYGLPRPDVFRGLVVMSGALRDAEDLRKQLPSTRSQPVFVSHGRSDPQITIEHGRETRAFLEGEGYAVSYNEYDMGHSITDAVIRDVTAWLHSTLPPKLTAG